MTEKEKIIKQYFKEIGTNQRAMAASPESIEYCSILIKSNSIDRILDCGSGLSTALFNLEFDHVETVDDDVFWAKTTRKFVKKNLGKEIKVERLTKKMNEKYDFIFYDYGDMETRIYYFKLILFMASKFIYLDDMHISYYHDYVKSVCKDHKLRIIMDTKDEFGRFGALITK